VQDYGVLHYADNQRNQFQNDLGRYIDVFPEKIAPWPTFSNLTAHAVNGCNLRFAKDGEVYQRDLSHIWPGPNASA